MRQVKIRVVHVVDDRTPWIERRTVQRMPRALHHQNIRTRRRDQAVPLRQGQGAGQHQAAPPEARQCLRDGMDSQQGRALTPVGRKKNRQRPPAPSAFQRIGPNGGFTREVNRRARQRPQNALGMVLP